MERITLLDIDNYSLVLDPSYYLEGHYSKGFWVELDTPNDALFFKLEQFRKLNEACLAVIAHLEALEKDA